MDHMTSCRLVYFLLLLYARVYHVLDYSIWISVRLWVYVQPNNSILSTLKLLYTSKWKRLRLESVDKMIRFVFVCFNNYRNKRRLAYTIDIIYLLSYFEWLRCVVFNSMRLWNMGFGFYCQMKSIDLMC